MKLQKQLSRKVGTKKYEKWVITIPSDNIKEAKWKEGLDLDIEVKGKNIILRPKD